MCPMTHPIQQSFQMLNHYRLYHTAGDQQKPSMAIQLPFLCVYHGGLKGVTSSTRRMDSTVVPPPASNSWTYMMWLLSHSLRYSTTEITFAESSCVNGSICSSIMTKTPCFCLKWQSRQNTRQLKTMSLLLKMDSTLNPCVLYSVLQRRLFFIMKRRWHHSTMLVGTYYLIPSAFTKGSTIMRVARYLYRLNCCAGIVWVERQRPTLHSTV